MFLQKCKTTVSRAGWKQRSGSVIGKYIEGKMLPNRWEPFFHVFLVWGVRLIEMLSFWCLFKACISNVSVTIRWLCSLRNSAIKRWKFDIKQVCCLQKQDPLWVSVCWEAQKLSHYPVLMWYNVLGISLEEFTSPSLIAEDSSPALKWGMWN